MMVPHLLPLQDACQRQGMTAEPLMTNGLLIVQHPDADHPLCVLLVHDGDGALFRVVDGSLFGRPADDDYDVIAARIADYLKTGEAIR